MGKKIPDDDFDLPENHYTDDVVEELEEEKEEEIDFNNRHGEFDPEIQEFEGE